MNAINHRMVEVHWTATNDPARPYSAEIGNDEWTIRINDFPDERLYTLLVNGQEAESFDDWPDCWERPPRDDTPDKSPPTMTDDLFDRRHPLSTQEREILLLWAEGVSNKEIAARLELPSAKVTSHVKRLMDRLAVATRHRPTSRRTG